jgi:putative transposase
LKTFSYVGCAQYFLTFCVYRREHIFVSAPAVDVAMTQIRHAATANRFAILAYCFMRDHVHLLVEGLEEGSSLREFVHAAKRGSGYALARERGKRGSVWQDGYYERVLRPSESPQLVARYILQNPVRAGLAQSPGDYPYLGSDVWSLDDLFESTL